MLMEMGGKPYAGKTKYMTSSITRVRRKMDDTNRSSKMSVAETEMIKNKR